MSTRIRLQRAGMKKAPFYRVVVADQRSPRDGRFIELLGRYNPRTEPATVELDVEKTEAWIAKGAQPSEVVVKLLAIAKGEKELPKAEKAPSKKSVAAAAAAEEAKAKQAEEAAAAAAAAAEAEAAAGDEVAAEASADEAEADTADATEQGAEAVEDEAAAGDESVDEAAAEDAE